MIEGSDQIYAGPDGTALRFYHAPTKNNFQSEKNGRPIFDTSLMVEVMVPGSRESTPLFEVERVFCEEAGTDGSGNRLVDRSPKYVMYEKMVEAFKTQSGEGVNAGTPLSQWPQIDTGTIATLKAAGIQTVEMLAGVNDSALHNLGIGGRVLRDQAQGYLNSRQFGIPSAQMAAETANMRDENVRIKAENDDLTGRLSQALAELAAARTGQPAPPPASGGPDGMLTDTQGPGTISQPNPFATLNSTSASPLTPTEGEANDGAKAQAERQQAPLI